MADVALGRLGPPSSIDDGDNGSSLMPPPGAPLSQGRPPRRPPRRPPTARGCDPTSPTCRLVLDAASRRRGAKSCIFAGVAEDQRHPPPAPPHLKPITKISARNLKSDEWSAVAIRPEHDQGASAADTGFVEDVVPRALPVCLEQLSTPTASSVPAEPAAPSRLPARSQARLILC